MGALGAQFVHFCVQFFLFVCILFTTCGTSAFSYIGKTHTHKTKIHTITLRLLFLAWLYEAQLSCE